MITTQHYCIVIKIKIVHRLPLGGAGSILIELANKVHYSVGPFSYEGSFLRLCQTIIRALNLHLFP